MKKYFLRFVTGLIFVSLFFVIGCSEDNSVVNGEVEKRVIGSIHGVVTDANDNARLEEAVVKVVQKDKMYTTKTDSLGYYIVKELYSGNYEATFHIDGYAVSRAYGYIPTVEEIADAKLDLNYEEVLDMDLFTLNAGLTGKLYKVIDDGNIVAASGVTVIADFDHFDISPNEYTAITNASGVFTFTNLPAASMVTVRTLPYNDGTYSFDPTMQMVELHPAVSVIAPDMRVIITDAAPFVLTHNLQDGFLIGSDIIMTFNKAIDPNSFKVYLDIAKATKTEITSVVWSNGNMTVTINPDENLLLDTWYYMWFEGKSADGNEFGNDYYFETQHGIDISTSNLELYDGFYSITTAQEITVVFSEAVNISSSYNDLEVRGWDIDNNYLGFYTVSASWSADKKTLTIPPPSGDYQKGEIRLRFTYYSSLGQDDAISFDEYIEVR
ncbi:MAG: carboxypeptidase regulatory-like domain-containing protein [Candidatus Delongbacteria bacterium]|nr:carboxypeptidase regulatory-like domain-containing protein [Candidatus Delongbacteria bacterium]MCG2760230.1 carboxypeptidase regulatory-like domain-containing protein [Candidatus Delongbacteria bacterium]